MSHRLVVHDDPEDVLDILHPPQCEGEKIDWGNGLSTVSYDCDVAWHVDAVGIDWDFAHAFAEPMPWDSYRTPERLLPGVYQLWVEIEKHRCWDCLGGYEYDSYTYVEPQRAIEPMNRSVNG